MSANHVLEALNACQVREEPFRYARSHSWQSHSLNGMSVSKRCCMYLHVVRRRATSVAYGLQYTRTQSNLKEPTLSALCLHRDADGFGQLADIIHV